MNNNQRDPRWASQILGFGTSSQTIGLYGCTVSALGDVLGLTPDVVNEKLKAVNGFSGALIIWAKIEEAFPGVKVNRVWSYNNDDVLAHVPNVIVEVPATPIGGTGSHWVNYIGNHQLKDPWTGSIRPTSDFPNPTGYCTFDLSGYNPNPPSPTNTDLDVCRTDRDTNWNLFTFLCGLLKVEVNADDKNSTKQRAGEEITNLQTQAAQVSSLETQLSNKDTERETAVNQAKETLENQFALDKEAWSTERTSLNQSVAQLQRRLNEKLPQSRLGVFFMQIANYFG